MKKITVLILLITISSLSAQVKKAITPEDLWSMGRIGSFDVSPGDDFIVFSLTEYDINSNKGDSDIWIIGTDGQGLKTLVDSEINESSPLFLPGGNEISFVKDNQIWICDLSGKNLRQLTDIYSGASGAVWTEDAKKMLFISQVYPECLTQKCNEEKDKQKTESKIKASLFTELMYKHWNDWRGDKRSHLFLYNNVSGSYTDLIPGSKADVPPIALGSSSDYDISPDGNEAVFTMNESDFIAASTNNDIYIVNLENLKNQSTPKSEKISLSPGNDNQPVYSPNAKYIAFRSMKRAGFEADKLDLIIYDRKTKELKNLSEKYDLSIGEIVWSDDSNFIFFTSSNKINNSIYKISVQTGSMELVLEKHVNSSLQFSGKNNRLYFLQQASTRPSEIFSVKTDGSGLNQITSVNTKRLETIEMNEVETFWSDGAEGKTVESILIKPPFFDPSKKYPMIFLIHGGPQGHWSDDFHYRWNLQLFASSGYVVVAPNPRSSTGYGQKFTDQISLDWGGKVYEDLMNSYDTAINKYEFIDAANTFAAGASYGGYMINWIEGHTDRFKALVCHAGVFNLESMYGATEELWFPEWEFGGPPWENRELYEKWSPHRYANNFKTPMLVVHGAFDFRVPEGQAFELFTTLQRKNVESKFLYFPDEYHFITKPQNALLWWDTIFNWFENYITEN